MKPSEKIEQLEKELATAQETNAALVKEIEMLKSQKPQAPSRPSKSREQAMAALEMLKSGPVTAAQLKTLNEKYPSDPIYYVRTLLQQEVKTARVNGVTCYMLPEQHAVWLEGQKKEKEQKAAEPAAEAPQAPAPEAAAAGAAA